jgi:acetoin utilization protein AcuB
MTRSQWRTLCSAFMRWHAGKHRVRRGSFRLEEIMRVQDVMTKEVQTIAPTASAVEAWELMRGRRIHHLVVTKGREVIGVLSDRDAGGRAGTAVRRTRTVSELMTRPAVTVGPAATIKKAANVMRGRSIGCLVVVDAGRAVGIVTVSDLLELVGRGMDRGASTTSRPLLNFRAPHRKVHRPQMAW